MILFKDNPNLDLSIINTHNGEKEYKVNCKKIKGEYFRINEDCFLVEGKWYRLKSGLIALDYETGNYVLDKRLVSGVVSFKEDGSPIMGKFTPNPYNNVVYETRNGTQYICLNSEILINSGRIEDFSLGVWYDKNHPAAALAQVPRNILDHTGKGYSIEDNSVEFKQKIDLYNKYKPVMSKNLLMYSKFLGDTTFGVELECSHGTLPDNIQNRTGVVICRDGSLKDENGMPGPEFVTIPLQGAKGLQTISTLCKELTKRTKININCSLHIHFGNIPTSRAYLVSLYKLCYKIQNEIFTMFPYYKANPDGVKNKNYNKKLPSLYMSRIAESCSKEDYNRFINGTYYKIFSWLTEGYTPDAERNRKNRRHPTTTKWERHARYYWINFMNTIFSERNTLEFRLHGPTTNQQKVVNWLFICNAILKYTHSHQSKILSSNCTITLNEILDYYERFGNDGKFLSEYLKAYVSSRKDMFLNDYKNNDHISYWDIDGDKDYEFIYKNIKNLF